jgi:FkbM family methyltransferase
VIRAWQGLRRLRGRLFDRYARISYAQCGEDLIVRHLLLDVLGRTEIRYLDIGAHHPWFLSNTALLYRMGFAGVCVEPDAAQYRHLCQERPRDICLHAGIGLGAEAAADFYVLSAPTLNTFSKEQAERYVAAGHRLVRVEQMPLLSVNAVLSAHFPRPPEFVSIDVEGLDEGVLRSLDFGAHRPDVLSIETVTYSDDRRQSKKREPIMALMAEKGYLVYADTFINTIFVNGAIW